jgi:uncharacterized protein
MPMPETPADLSRLSLAAIAQAVADKKLPPVESWNPAQCGDSEMRIARDGTWYHQGSPINRTAMVQLFSTILRRESDGRFVLVTPAEKLDIIVEDAPFIAVEVKIDGTGKDRTLAFRLNVGEVVIAGPGHAIRLAQSDDGPQPYLHIRAGLEARMARPVYYELANLAIDEGTDPPGLWSGGAFFAMAPAS